MTSLEKKFNADMHNIYITAKKELGYNASRFMQLVSQKGVYKQQNSLSPQTAVLMALKFYGNIKGWTLRRSPCY